MKTQNQNQNPNTPVKRKAGRPKKSPPLDLQVSSSISSDNLTFVNKSPVAATYTPKQDMPDLPIKVEEPKGGFPTFLVQGKTLPQIYESFIRKYKKSNKDDGSNSEGNHVENFLNTMQIFLSNFNAIDLWQVLPLRENIPVELFKTMFYDLMGQLVENKLIYKIDGCYEYSIYSFYPFGTTRKV
jgi:hypothetical protein